MIEDSKPTYLQTLIDKSKQAIHEHEGSTTALSVIYLDDDKAWDDSIIERVAINSTKGYTLDLYDDNSWELYDISDDTCIAESH